MKEELDRLTSYDWSCIPERLRKLEVKNAMKRILKSLSVTQTSSNTKWYKLKTLK